MALFTVTNIIDGNTIEVNGWKWNNYAGKRVRIRGYNITPITNQFAKNKLEILLKNKQIELKAPVSAEKGTEDKNDLVECVVALNDIDVAQYFPELISGT